MARRIPLLALALLIVACEEEPTATVNREPPSDWTVVNLINEFGESVGRVARSRWEHSIQPISGLLSDLEAVVLVRCDEPWFRFRPVLLDSELGTSAIDIRVRLDGQEHDTWFGDKGNSHADGDDLTVRRTYHRRAMNALRTGETMAIAIDLIGNEAAAFRWSLAGAPAAIDESCTG